MVLFDLVEPEDLGEFPGAPFPRALVAAAAGAVRAEAGWHIAPVMFETVEVETGCGSVAMLPSLRVTRVVEVRDLSGGVLDGWRVSRASGVLRRVSGRWPDVIEVDFEHGYDVCPPELVPVVAERAQRGKAGIVRQENLGSRSISLAQNDDPVSGEVLARYALPPRP